MGTLIYIIYAVAVVYSLFIFARIVLSWSPARPGSPVFLIKGALFTLTEPYLGLFRRLLPVARIGSVGLDLSALVGLVILFIVIQVLARI
jgi:YggT family protein